MGFDLGLWTRYAPSFLPIVFIQTANQNLQVQSLLKVLFFKLFYDLKKRCSAKILKHADREGKEFKGPVPLIHNLSVEYDIIRVNLS